MCLYDIHTNTQRNIHPVQKFCLQRREREGRLSRTRTLNEMWKGDREKKCFTIHFFGNREICIGSSRVVKIFFHLLIICRWNYYDTRILFTFVWILRISTEARNFY